VKEIEYIAKEIKTELIETINAASL